jgi:hypothetical protein
MELSGHARSSSSVPPHPQPSIAPPLAPRVVPPTLFLRPRPPLESLVTKAAHLPAAVTRGPASLGHLEMSRGHPWVHAGILLLPRPLADAGVASSSRSSEVPMSFPV